MRRMRIVGLVFFTLMSLTLLALAIAGVGQKVHGWGSRPRLDDPVISLPSLVPSLFGLLLPVIMLAAAGGLWARWWGQNARSHRAERLPKGFVPRSKYAAWADSLGDRAGRLSEQSGPRASKPLRRKG